MDHHRHFVRPLLARTAAHGSAFAEILANRAEHDPALAGHLLDALAEVERAFPGLDADDAAKPIPSHK